MMPIMIRISSESELVESFRPIDRSLVLISSEILFPMLIKDYFAWIEPTGSRTFLVLDDHRREKPLGIVFKISRGGEHDPTPKMCQWCHAVRGGDRVTTLSVQVSPRRRVGLHLCKDLSCKGKAHALPGPNDPPERLRADEKVMRVMARMSDFAYGNLF